jgi:hypothetical protein
MWDNSNGGRYAQQRPEIKAIPAIHNKFKLSTKKMAIFLRIAIAVNYWG